jgi:DNA polymerase III subunit epsilon
MNSEACPRPSAACRQSGPAGRRLAFVDLETTGATATADRITEIGIVEVDEDGVREWSSLVNPQARIPEFIERLTGISNAMVASAPTFEELADEVRARLDGRLFIAHNARFDYGFLKNEFARLGMDFRATVLCTVKLSRRLYPEQRKHSLDSLIERHGLVAGDRHRALADAQLIHQFWHHLHATFDVASIEAAVTALTARPSLPAHLDASLVDALPEGHGVYLFYGENELPLYVGKSKGVRKRVLAHFAADHASNKEMSLARQVRRVDWIVTEGEIGAQLTEAALIKRLQPVHNRRLRRNDELCGWQLRRENKDLWRPYLVAAADVDFAYTEDLFGPFKHAREARRALTGIADEHGLCHALLGLEKVKSGRPCSSHQIRVCRGACVGKEPLSTHSGRLMSALAGLRIKPWPFEGPALLREGDQAYAIDGWRFLGSVRSDDEIRDLLDSPRPAFDHDIYKILVKAAGRLSKIPPH